MASLMSLHFRVNPRTTASGSFLTQSRRKPTCWARPCLCLSSKDKGLRVSAMVKGSDAADDDGAGDDVNSLETLKQRSKKVLAIQKDLLQKVAERRKLVSSIKSSAISAEQDSVPSDNSDRTSSNETLERKYSGSILSNSSVQSTKARFSDPPGGYDGSSFEKEKEAASNINNESMTSNVTRQVKDSYPKSSKSKILSPSIFEVSKLLEDDNTEVRNEVNTHFNEEPDVVAEETVDSPPLAGENVMNVLVVAAECAPWSKTGGLGDVAGALPKALAKRGHRVMVVAPRYSNYAESKDTGVRKRYKVAGQDMEVTYFHAYIDGVDFVFIDHSVFRHYEKSIYAGDRLELLKRMVLFCKAAVEVPWHVPCGGVCYGDGNLVFVANDWHTALVPVYLKAYYQNQGLMSYARSVLVIHNIAHQGRGPVDDFYSVDLPEHYINLFKLYDPLGGDHFNVFAAGLKCADRIVTVSHGYAWELTTPEGGWGLHRIINENEWKIRGIVNGIDTEEWNPSLNMHLKTDGYTNYSLETLDTGKPTCKAALQRELGLPVRDDVPIIAFIGRLDPQKGVDLIGEAVPWIVEKDVQLVMLGSGRPDLEDMLRRLEGEHRDKVRGWVGFSVRMAHRITAGADILLMPSRFEPCGLNQLYAMNYGTVPVVHAVGGLRDTVGQFDPYSESGYGWTFPRAEVGELIHALGNCLHTYWNYKSSWKGLQRRGMMLDLSWGNAAQQYEEVFIAAKYQW